MSIYDEDEDVRHAFDASSWEEESRETPTGREVAPDDLSAGPCLHCRKLILEGTRICPYCSRMQMAEHREKPWWFWLLVLAGAAAMGGAMVMGSLAMLRWHS